MCFRWVWFECIWFQWFGYIRRRRPTSQKTNGEIQKGSWNSKLAGLSQTFPSFFFFSSFSFFPLLQLSNFIFHPLLFLITDTHTQNMLHFDIAQNHLTHRTYIMSMLPSVWDWKIPAFNGGRHAVYKKNCGVLFGYLLTVVDEGGYALHRFYYTSGVPQHLNIYWALPW